MKNKFDPKRGIGYNWVNVSYNGRSYDCKNRAAQAYFAPLWQISIFIKCIISCFLI